MKYDFDEYVSREKTDSLTVDGWREYLFSGQSEFAMRYPAEGLINLWVADMAFATPEPILQAIRDRLDRKILGYTKIYDEEYYEIFGNWCERQYGHRFKTEDIVLSPGIIPALNRLVPLLTDMDDSILIMTPSYGPFKKAGEYSQRRVVYSALKKSAGGWEPDWEDFARKASQADLRVKILFLCNPHNPTGRVWRPDELKRIIEICLANDIWVISDEIHCDLSRSGIGHTPAASLFPDSTRIITCMSSSKTFNLAGNLLANIIIPDPGVRSEWRLRHDEFISPLSLAANKAAWSECDDWLVHLREYIDGNFQYLHDYLKSYLPETRFSIPEGTYLAWIDISHYLPDTVGEDLSLYFARESGVLLEGGLLFVDNGEGHIRLNLACPRTMLTAGMKRISQVLRTPAPNRV